MSKLRLLFIKEAQASYISHLDLLRTFQRAFPRTELDIKHSQGYHPHPIISIVLPLPVGQSSDCELLDFEVTQETDGAGIAEKLNGGLPEGLTILDCYEARRPVRELTYLQADMELDYDRGVPHGAAQALTELLRRVVADGTRSVLFSTHITSDLEKCATHIAFIKDGEMQYTGSLGDFRDHYKDVGVTLEDIIVHVERRPLDEGAII